MNGKLVFSIGLLVFLVASCKTKTGQNAKQGEGTVTYHVSYSDSAKYGLKAALFPRTMDLFFKDEKATFVTSAGMGTMQLVNLLDHKNKKFTILLIDALRQNYACTLSPDEIKKNESTPEYKFEFVDETKTIAGLICNKAIVKDLTNNTSFEVYYYDKIKFYYWNSPFKDFDFLLMEYTHTINNLTMKLVAQKVDLTTPVDSSFFQIKGEFNWLNQKKIYNYLSRL